MKGKLLIFLLIFVFISCRKEDPIYDVNQIHSSAYNANKDKLKTTGQYISILYANLFQKALSANELVEITNCIESIGDKEVAHEIVLSNFMNKTGVTMPIVTRVRRVYDPSNGGSYFDTTFSSLNFVGILMSMDSTFYGYDSALVYLNPTLDSFLEQTYKRFYVRDITQAELKFFTDFLKLNPNVSAEMVYTAFSLSNEYQFY